MDSFKYPKDKNPNKEEDLITDTTIKINENKISFDSHIGFEVKISGVTSLDNNVKFKFYSGLGGNIFNSSNIDEVVNEISLNGLTGNLVFHREVINNIHNFYRIIISGTDSNSTASFLIRVRSVE